MAAGSDLNDPDGTSSIKLGVELANYLRDVQRMGQDLRAHSSEQVSKVGVGRCRFVHAPETMVWKFDWSVQKDRVISSHVVNVRACQGVKGALEGLDFQWILRKVLYSGTLIHNELQHRRRANDGALSGSYQAHLCSFGGWDAGVLWGLVQNLAEIM